MGVLKDAREAGRTRYHGRPCRHPGHGTERKAANGECVVCWRLRKRRQPDYAHGSRRRKAEAKGFAPRPLPSMNARRARQTAGAKPAANSGYSALTIAMRPAGSGDGFATPAISTTCSPTMHRP